MRGVSLVIITLLVISVFVCAIKIANSTTLSVGPGKPYSTITSAINAANPGDTVLVYPGTYHEEVDISKQLNLTSAGGASQTFIDGSTGVTLASAGLVKITPGGNVTFSGFTVENAPLDPSLNEYEIFSSSSTSGVTYTITSNNIVGTGDTNSADMEVGFYSQNDQANCIFKYNNITNIGGNNIVFEVHIGTTEISYNKLAAGMAGGDSVFFMTYGGANVTTLQNVSGNTFNMGLGPFDYADRSTGVSICTHGVAYGQSDAQFTNVLIQGNVFNNLNSNRRGIGFWNGGGSAGGTIAPIIQNNVVNGVTGSVNSSGVDFIGVNAAQNATVSYNTVSNCSTGVELRTAGCAPGLTVNYNSFIHNNVGLNNTLGPSSVDARYNYWGDSSGPGGSGPGTGQPIIGSALFDPWLSAYQLPASAQISVNPATVEKFAFGGIQISDFNVSINLQSVTDLFGFEINLTWDNNLLNLVGVEFTPELNQMWGPGPPSGTNWTSIQNLTQNGWYDLVATALNPTKGYNGAATLAKLTFRVVNLPCYISQNYQLQTRFHFATTKLANSNGNAIGALVNDGHYLIHAEPPILQILPATVICSKLNQSTSVQLEIVDALDVYSIDVQIHYNTTLSKVTSIQWLDLSGFLPGPYLNKTIVEDDLNGIIRVLVVENLTAGAPLAYGDRLLVNVTFMTIKAITWKNAAGYTNNLTDSISLNNWDITVSCPGIYSLTNSLVITSSSSYSYVPIRGDVNWDGKVNAYDLSAVASYYGVHTYDPAYLRDQATYGIDFDLNNDGIIDILDIVVVSENIGYNYSP